LAEEHAGYVAIGPCQIPNITALKRIEVRGYHDNRKRAARANSRLKGGFSTIGDKQIYFQSNEFGRVDG
jgi:hypothetical protein